MRRRRTAPFPRRRGSRLPGPYEHRKTKPHFPRMCGRIVPTAALLVQGIGFPSCLPAQRRPSADGMPTTSPTTNVSWIRGSPSRKRPFSCLSISLNSSRTGCTSPTGKNPGAPGTATVPGASTRGYCAPRSIRPRHPGFGLGLRAFASGGSRPLWPFPMAFDNKSSATSLPVAPLSL